MPSRGYRKESTERLRNRIKSSCTDHQRIILDSACELSGLTQAAFVRNAACEAAFRVLNNAARSGVPLEPHILEALSTTDDVSQIQLKPSRINSESVRQLIGLSTNLNQLTKQANAAALIGGRDFQRKIDNLVSGIEHTLERINHVLRKIA